MNKVYFQHQFAINGGPAKKAYVIIQQFDKRFLDYDHLLEIFKLVKPFL
jgi:hypothetical protein